MKLPTIRGLIDRRILANYRIAPEAFARILPPPFRPKLMNGFGIVGICLIRLKEIRPRGVPKILGVSSENAAHRIAVEWDDEPTGQVREGVFIPRRDSSSRLNVLAGGRLFTGVHHHAHFRVDESADRFHIEIDSDDNATRVRLDATIAQSLPDDSVFDDLPVASEFFRGGSLGYSISNQPDRLDALELESFTWNVRPLAVHRVESSFFDDPDRFPTGSIHFDCALLMRGVEHEWHERSPMCIACPAPL
jgi:Uncharacterized conserved protein (COG2071)